MVLRIAVYWSAKRVNFGDSITPLILKYYGFTPVWQPIRKAQVISTGSIMQGAGEGYPGHVLGSGLIINTRRNFSKATFWAVRGRLTRERVNAPKKTVLGDPGLLLPYIFTQDQRRKYALGMIPHLVDRGDPRIENIRNKYRKDVSIIDVGREPSEVFAEIRKCDCILSSSLHGLIAAHSLGIPSAWIHLSNKVIGKGFKFYDYHTAFGIECEPVIIDGSESISQLIKQTIKPPEYINEVIGELGGAFEKFKAYFMTQ